MSGASVRQAYYSNVLPMTTTTERARVPYAAVPWGDEDQAERCRDWPQLTEEKE